AGSAFGAQGKVGGRDRLRGAEPAEFLVLLEWRRPEMRPVADDCAADGVDDGEGADCDAVRRRRGGRADAALERGGGGAEARAGSAEREIRFGCVRGLVAEFAVWRVTAPILVAAVEQVEQDRAGHDRHRRLANAEAAAMLTHIGLHAGGGIE